VAVDFQGTTDAISNNGDDGITLARQLENFI
jgi:hypothetical protein